MSLSDIKKIMKMIVLAPLIPVVWVMSRIMHEILLSSGCHRCRAMIESGIEADMGYTARVRKKYRSSLEEEE